MNTKTLISFAITVLTVLTFGLPTEVRAEHGRGEVGGRGEILQRERRSAERKNSTFPLITQS